MTARCTMPDSGNSFKPGWRRSCRWERKAWNGPSARPAERVGVNFEPGLVASIVGDVHYQPGALPLLQYALTELFERRQGRLLTHEAYHAIGGTVGALAKRAEQIYAELTEQGQEAARQMFLRLVTLGEGIEDTRRRAPRSELLAIGDDQDVMDDVIETYAAYRLLTLDNDPGTRSPTVEIAHEAILREWERLRKWISGNREEIRMQQQLAHQTEEWIKSGKDVSYLASGLRLTQFEKWAQESSSGLTATERAYLDASLAERARQQNVEIERQQRETTLKQLSQTFLRWLVAVLLLATLGALGLVAMVNDQSQTARAERDTAQRERQRAESQTRIAQARELVGYATANLSNDAELSTLLALQAVNTTYATDGMVLPEAEAVLHQAVQALHTPVQIPSEMLGPEDALYFGYSPDGKRIMYPKQFSIFSDGVGITGIADAITGKPLYEVSGDTMSVRISPNNTIVTMVQAENGSVLQLWDVSSDVAGKLLSTTAVPIQLEQTIGWMPGRTSADTLYPWQMISNRIWNLETGQEIITPASQQIPEGNGKPAFSPDGNYLANRNPDATVSILDSTSWEEVVHISPVGTGSQVHL